MGSRAGAGRLYINPSGAWRGVALTAAWHRRRILASGPLTAVADGRPLRTVMRVTARRRERSVTIRDAVFDDVRPDPMRRDEKGGNRSDDHHHAAEHGSYRPPARWPHAWLRRVR